MPFVRLFLPRRRHEWPPVRPSLPEGPTRLGCHFIPPQQTERLLGPGSPGRRAG
ncbi:hypothetical protein BN2537_11097 [Streptomyces venezuelae]|nr:hypothetical protein BN2537_11097 [Streptomyces venezuelae]